MLIRNSHNLFKNLTRYPVIRPAGYPANETGFPAGYWISKEAGYPASQISGTTLLKIENIEWLEVLIPFLANVQLQRIQQVLVVFLKLIES